MLESSMQLIQKYYESIKTCGLLNDTYFEYENNVEYQVIYTIDFS